MGKAKKTSTSQSSSRTFTIPNKLHRQAHNARVKSAVESAKRKERFQRKKDEDRDPTLREERLRKNVPATLERKRVWDERVEAEKAEEEETTALFPTLETPPSISAPKILITTSRNCHIHEPAEQLTQLFPNSTYIPRGREHKFSIKEISAFASNPTTTTSSGRPREPYTHLIVVNEDRKIINALTIVVLPAGPTFHFSLTNYVPPKRISGHGKPTDHIPELILNNFLTPLGKGTSSLFQSMFPRQPEIRGRQVVTLHNQRDYIFFRRHRYVIPIKVGLQELGPQFTLKLRRVERGIKEGVEWEWKGEMEKDRKRFQL
ncbi:ribosome production factor 1 [Choiromyces venosus 120613-1]|uniref:Ribosome production factor 1 n=1 Tax=Choiromyces venosus 120613-1 TaxID=1336337 RepID=A0A3N4JZA9_9PEZI|nr:ribosome production factor 1 [Choiromyces venosus 120613-1]